MTPCFDEFLLESLQVNILKIKYLFLKEKYYIKADNCRK